MTTTLLRKSNEWEVTDPSGYHFRVRTEFDDDTGWHAHVTLSARGFKNEPAAIDELRRTAQMFLRVTEPDA